MEASKGNKFITPTLQSNWNYSINEVLRRMNNSGIADIWKSVETLYMILPPAIFDEVEEEYTRIVKRVNEANDGSNIDFLRMVESNNEVCLVLEKHTFPFFRRMYSALYEGNYLEKAPIAPRHKERRKLAV